MSQEEPLSQSSRALVESAASGEDGALDALVERHLPALRAFVRLQSGDLLEVKESPSDLVQSACREVLVDLERHAYRSEGHFRNWLYTAALRKIKDRGRYWSRQRRDARRECGEPGPEASISGLLGLTGAHPTPSENAIAQETAERLERAFESLSSEQREVIIKSRLCGMTHAEIAEVIEKSEVAVRQIYSRAVARLLLALEPGGD